MTVSSSTNKVSYSGNGSLTTFAYTFKIFDQSDVVVILRAADGTETVQTITTHYTVTGVGSASGGNVVFGSAPASGVTVVILRSQPLTQGLDLVANDPFDAESLEEALDKLTFMSQKHEEELSRAIKGSRTNVISNSEFTVSATDRANKVFSFDASGNLSITQELGTFKGNWAASTAYVERDLVKDTTTNNVFIVNTAHTSTGSLPLTTNANSAKYEKIIDVTNPPGNFNVGGDLVVTGSITGGSFVIGSADINENDLEAIDSVTAGTVAASKAVVVDVNKDIASFRNLTASGTLTGGTVTASTDLNIAGDGATVTGIKDEDDMLSNSATKLATQQSIKAYVDSQVATSDTLTEVLGNGNISSGTNIQMTTTDELQFRDTALKISSSTDGQLDIDADTEVEITAPTVDVTGNLTVSGNTTLGDASSDTITPTGYFAGHLVPSADNLYDLGTSNNEWRSLYIDGTAYIDSLDAGTVTTGSSVTLESTSTNASANPQLILDRQSSSPANDDELGLISFRGKSTSNNSNFNAGYASIKATIVDANANGSSVFATGKLTVTVNGNGAGNNVTNDYVFNHNSLELPHSSIIFEGSSADDHETTLTVTNPTADRTITLPNVTGTVVTTGNLSDITSIGTMSGGIQFANLQTLKFGDANTSIIGNSSSNLISIKPNGDSNGEHTFKTDSLNLTNGAVSIKFEDASDASISTNFTRTTPTANRTITLPDATGHVPVFATAATAAVTDGSAGQVLTTDGSGALSFSNAFGSDITTSTVESGGSINIDGTATGNHALDLKIGQRGAGFGQSLTTGTTISNVEAFPEKVLNSDGTLPNPQNAAPLSSLTVRGGNALRLEAGNCIIVDAPIAGAEFTQNINPARRSTDSSGQTLNSGTIDIDLRQASMNTFLILGNTTFNITDVEIGQGATIGVTALNGTVSWSCAETQSNGNAISVNFLTTAGSAGTTQPSWLVSGKANWFEIWRDNSIMYVAHIGAN